MPRDASIAAVRRANLRIQVHCSKQQKRRRFCPAGEMCAFALMLVVNSLSMMQLRFGGECMFVWEANEFLRHIDSYPFGCVLQAKCELSPSFASTPILPLTCN